MNNLFKSKIIMIMKKYSWLLALALTFGFSSCTDLDEKVYDRIDASTYYQNETSVQGALASIYNQAGNSFAESFFFLQELPADQIAWRVWNGGQWGYDEAEKYVLSTQTWSPESKIIRSSWESAWSIIGLSNNLINDLASINPASIKMTQTALDSYIAEVRTLRAWAYYNLFEIWGGALPLNTASGGEVPGVADTDWNTSCKKIYDFICSELDESNDILPKENGDNSTRNRMNQGVNRILKARMLLNSQLFIGEDHYNDCEDLCLKIFSGDYGSYNIADDYRDIYNLNNTQCSEVVFAFAAEDGQGATNALTNMRNMPFLPYNYYEYADCEQFEGIGAWNCVIVVPSHDNSGTVLPTGGTDTGGKSFITDYNDKLGGVWDRMDDRDIRKQNYVYDSSTKNYKGIFLKGAMKASFGKGNTLKADADRDGQNLVYVDQLGTFLNLGRNLETVMSPRWGETNSGIRLMRYPMFAKTENGGFKDIDEVEFRLAEVAYMIAECRMRAGDATGAKEYVDKVRSRYFTDKAALNIPGPGFTSFDMDWMLSQWGLEYLAEGRRRRTDLRRFDKFTQGQWWFFGRATEDGFDLPAKRNRKYEWYPLPASALSVNPGLIQNPNYLN